MFHALFLNLAILGLIAFVIFLTSNPLALLGIVFLKDMPYGLLAQDDSEEEEENDAAANSRKIGFITED
jgi:hypothetical protein